MATRIVILERTSGGRFRYALWADVPVARQSFYADVNKKSVWLGASVTENADIAAGKIVERTDEAALPPGATIPQIQAALEATWQAFQNEINNTNHWTRYGTKWDGTTWTAAGVS